MRVLLSGGGTAGHINPALSIATTIKQHIPDAQILFAGTPFGMEARLIPEAGYDFTPIKVRGFQRSFTPDAILKNIKACYYLALSSSRSRRIIKDFNPDIVIGTGGYVCGPILRTAAKMGIKTAVHESNAFPGVTVKLLAKQVDVVMIATDDARRHLDKSANCIVTGNPLSDDFLNINKADARAELGIASDDMCILSYGGSLGAGRINETVVDLIEWESTKNDIHHIHAYGGMGKDSFLPALHDKGIDEKKNHKLDIREYINNMNVCLAAADLVISRAGAMTLTQLQEMSRASILIPSPIVAENHQYHNAMVLENQGAAIVIEQSKLSSDLLIEKVSELYKNRDKLQTLGENAGKMAISNASDRILSVILDLLPDLQ